MNDWIEVINKPKIKTQTKRELLSKSFIIEKLKLLEKYNPKLVVLYGSYARNEQKESSDIDVLVVWNKLPDTQEIKQELVKLFNRKVDLVSMLYKNKSVDFEYDKDFIDNIIVDGIIITGNNKYDILMSNIILKD